LTSTAEFFTAAISAAVVLASEVVSG